MCKDLDCPYTETIIGLAKDMAVIKCIILKYHRVVKAALVILAAYFGIDYTGLV